MTPQYVRFLVEEVLENRIGFYPTYGNTLMGLAASVPLTAEDKFLDHLLRSPASRGVASGRSQKTDEPVKLRRLGSSRADNFDQRILHAALPRTRRSPAPPAAPALCVGWSRGSPPLRSDGKNIVEGVY